MAELPQAPDPEFPRLSARAFPSYRFVPGRTAHPAHTTPAPHLSDDDEALLCEAQAAARDGRSSERFCYGTDLYNYAYWWEAHEAWEPLWLAFALGDPPRRVLQALIQISAAHLQAFRGLRRGAGRLIERAEANLTVAHASQAGFFGLDVCGWFAESAKPYFDGRRGEYPFLRFGS